jgi:hypothetical protein
MEQGGGGKQQQQQQDLIAEMPGTHFTLLY